MRCLAAVLLCHFSSFVMLSFLLAAVLRVFNTTLHILASFSCHSVWVAVGSCCTVFLEAYSALFPNVA